MMPAFSSPTLIHLLQHHAQNRPDKVAYTFQNEPRNFIDLWEQINQFATFLQMIGLQRQEPVVMALSNSHEFFDTFYGVQRAGGIAVPIFPGFSPDRMLNMVQLCGAKIIIVPSTTPAAQLEHFRQQIAHLPLRIITPDERVEQVERHTFPSIAPDDIAFIQYTSGSTGNPKGVQLSHYNLLTNARQMIAGMEITPDDIFVSWLPVYHDMGLILKTIVPFYLNAQLHLLPANLRDVRPWLETITQKRGTFTAAPDFAYRLVLRRVDSADYDLTSLRVALNAAEPVRAGTITAFESAFELQNVMVAGYGLAEATVGVSMWQPQTPPKIDSNGYVSVGGGFPNVEISILDDGGRMPAGETGEIAVKSPANTTGYYRNPTATTTLFADEETILTGDLGYMDEAGCLYILGRKKNIIIHAGNTVYAEEIEELVDRLAEVRYSAAIGVDRGSIEGEQVVIFAEVRPTEQTSLEDWQGLVITIVQQFYGQFGFRPANVYLVKPKTIPLTHNGKLQHQQLKKDYLSGAYHQAQAILFPQQSNIASANNES